jgi:membrane-bound ClpP family serine protease
MINGKKEGFAFAKMNYQLLIAGVVLIIIGFVLMSGGGSADPKVYNPEIFNFRHITLAPIIVLSGFAVVMLSIMKKAKDA